MKISQLKEVIWKIYYNGRPKGTDQTLREKDVLQLIILCYGNLIRKKFIESKKLDKFNEADYSFTSPILDVKTFTLSESNTIGMRRAEVDFDLYRLPYNGHITNVYPIGGTCGSEEVGKISPISPVRNGEEVYYTKPKFKSFMFYTVVGRGFNFYNLPLCVDKVGIETTYNSEDVEVSVDIGFEIAIAVFGIMFKEKQFPVKILDNSYDPNTLDLKHKLQQQDQSS